MEDKERLLILDDLVVREILSLSESEIFDKTTDSDVAMTQRAFGAACKVMGKATLAEAKAALALVTAGAKLVPGLERMPQPMLLRASNVNQVPKLTMAARNQTTDHQEDQAGIDEDLAELDAWATQDKTM